MSERTYAPRSGGRAAEPRRGTARGDGLGRNADAQEAADREAAPRRRVDREAAPRRSVDREAAPRRGAARGVRHFADGETPADTRRSGIAGERRPADASGRLYQQIEIQNGPFRRVVELGPPGTGAGAADGALRPDQ